MTTTPPDTEPLFAGQPVLRTAYQQSVAAYWNAERDPVNIRLGEVDGFYHHHYGVGDYDATVLGAPANVRDQAIIAEMHRLESAQADLLLDQFGTVRPTDLLLDGGAGRGGTSFMANLRFGCLVDGVRISEAQVEFANAQQMEGKTKLEAIQLAAGISDRSRFNPRQTSERGFYAPKTACSKCGLLHASIIMGCLKLRVRNLTKNTLLADRADIAHTSDDSASALSVFM